MSPSASDIAASTIKKRWVRNSEGRWVAEQVHSPADHLNLGPMSHEKDSQYSGDYAHHQIIGKNILDQFNSPQGSVNNYASHARAREQHNANAQMSEQLQRFTELASRRDANENTDEVDYPPSIRKPMRIQANTSHQKQRVHRDSLEDDRPIDIVIGGTKVESSMQVLDSQQDVKAVDMVDQQTLDRIQGTINKRSHIKTAADQQRTGSFCQDELN